MAKRFLVGAVGIALLPVWLPLFLIVMIAYIVGDLLIYQWECLKGDRE